MNNEERALIKETAAKWGLSPIEIRVLNWLSHGKHNAEIADLVNVSVASVDSYIHRIKNKLGANSAAGAVGFALRRQIIR